MTGLTHIARWESAVSPSIRSSLTPLAAAARADTEADDECEADDEEEEAEEEEEEEEEEPTWDTPAPSSDGRASAFGGQPADGAGGGSTGEMRPAEGRAGGGGGGGESGRSSI